jgi:hypothetical protein
MHWIDPAYLPETRGKVTLFLLNPHGEMDGLMLDGTLQVHFPPHLSKMVAKHIAIGDRIRVRGVRARGAEMLAAVALTSTQGKQIVDEGPPHHEHPVRPEGRAMEAQGEVLRPLHGPKGEIRGALLKDGTSLRMAPHAAVELVDYLSAGAHIHAWGQGVKTKHGKTIDVHDIAHLVDAA